MGLGGIFRREALKVVLRGMFKVRCDKDHLTDLANLS